MLKSVFVVATTLTLWAMPTWAATVPTISGKYISTFNAICQAVDSNQDGLIDNGAEVTNFDSSTAMLHTTGYGIDGSLVVWPGGTAGLTQFKLSQTAPYSNTATTLTIDGIVYNVVYGTVKNGIAQSLAISGIGPNGCATAIAAFRQ
ncbi:MAG TPA: hypothetical protein VII49_00985 [Rhizomicrobium sp.]